MTVIECSLCGQEFNISDPLINERKKRHEERHDGKIYKFQNIIRGNVIWNVL